ncbi:MAG: hypothetical protein WKG07_21670 [Hymenobacter sp.]
MLKASAGEFTHQQLVSARGGAVVLHHLSRCPRCCSSSSRWPARCMGGEAANRPDVRPAAAGWWGPSRPSSCKTASRTFTLQDRSRAWPPPSALGTLIFTATTFFVTLQESINDIWNLKVKTDGIGIWRLRAAAAAFVRAHFERGACCCLSRS